jgi:hypothetical protein
MMARFVSLVKRMLALERDVGPSAGYFGCLGLVCARLPGRWRWLSGGAILTGLVGAILFPAQAGESEAMKLLADFAHLIAFPLGWFSSGIGNKRRK